MMHFNKVILIGTAKTKPEVKTSTKGTKYANFILETIEDRKGYTYETDHRISAFGFNADTSEEIRIGDSVLIEGGLQSNKWTDKNGNEQTNYSITASKISILNKNSHTSQIYQPAKNGEENDFPF